MNAPRRPSGYCPRSCEWYQYVPGWLTCRRRQTFRETRTTQPSEMLATDGEVILERASRWNATLRNASSTIHVCRAILEHAMPMQARRLISQLIVDIDNQTVSHRTLDGGNRPAAIDSNDRPWKGARWIRGYPGNVEIICDGGSLDKSG